MADFFGGTANFDVDRNVGVVAVVLSLAVGDEGEDEAGVTRFFGEEDDASFVFLGNVVLDTNGL